MERLNIEFPKVQRKDIDEQDAYFSLQDYIKIRRKAAIRDFNRQRILIKQKAENELVLQV